MMRPIIGITCSLRERDGGAIHELPDLYVQGVRQAGGLPVLLPAVDPDGATELVRELDGVIISGGRDIPPDLYGEEPHPATDTDGGMRRRALFEIALVKAMVKANKPTLGICYGCQLLNVAFGGTLYQDIPSQLSTSVPHKPSDRSRFADHIVQIDADSQLAHLLAATHFVVKSSHHQAVRVVGEGLRVVATAPDGVVEGVEAKDGKFVIGVQWHPEVQLDVEPSRRLFENFVQACKRASAKGR